METEENDKRSRNIGLMASFFIHGGVALLLFLLVAWKAPNPPNAEYGVEINLGFTDTGDGNIQPQAETGNEGLSEENSAVPQETQPQEEIKDESKEEKQQQEIVTDESNPVSVNTEKKEVKVAEKEIKKEVKTTPVNEKKVVNKESLFEPTVTTDKTTGQKKGENVSHGDDKNATGDKGKRDGKLDESQIFTQIQGGGADGTGTGLVLAGWTWNRLPRPVFPGNERGVIVYSIEVDEDGTIIGLKPDKMLSPETDRICREEIHKLTFTPTGSTTTGAKGKVTIVVTAE